MGARVRRMRGRIRERGSAAVETMLAVPFIVIFCLAMVDFGKGFRSLQQGQRSARQIAWSEARRDDDKSHPRAPSADDVREHHYEGRRGEITVAHRGTKFDAKLPLPGPVGTAAGILQGIGMDRAFKGVVSFLKGEVEATVGQSRQTIGGLRVVPTGKIRRGREDTVGGGHVVSLRSYVDEDPSDPEGWFDPFKWIKDKIPIIP